MSDIPTRFNGRLDPMICTARKSVSLMIWTTLVPKINAFWHKRLQCKSYQRQPSAAAGSRSSAQQRYLITGSAAFAGPPPYIVLLPHDAFCDRPGRTREEETTP